MARAIRQIGLIGAGKHGARYARHIRFDFPDLELAAIGRRNREQGAALAGELGARLFTDYRELIERGGVDAVIVVVPPTLHLDVVTCAARAGVPVLLEKPAAPSLAIGRELLAVLAAHPIPLMVAQTLRFNSVVRALAAACESIAPLRALAFTQRFEPSPLSWLDDPAQAGGGIVLHTGVHAFDLIRLFTGLEPDAVTCQTAAVRTRRTEDSFVAGVCLGGGSVLATVSCSRVAGARSGHIELTGERGMLVGDHVLHHATRVIGTAAEPLTLADPLPTVREVVRTFVGALRAGTPLPITLVDGLRAVALAEACYVAARSGQVTAVESVDDGPAAARGAA